MSAAPEAGRTYIVEHSRKGTFRARVVDVGDTWLDLVVLEEVDGLVRTWEEGETMSVRTELCVLTEVVP